MLCIAIFTAEIEQIRLNKYDFGAFALE